MKKIILYLCILLAVFCAYSDGSDVLTNDIQSITLRTRAGHTLDYEWEVCIPKSGEVTLSWSPRLDACGTNISVQLPRANARIKGIERIRSRFFTEVSKLNIIQYDKQYGEDLVDCSTRSITIATTQTNKTILILGLHNWQLRSDKNHKRLAEIVPLLKIWDNAYQWFVEPRLINFNDIDLKIIQEESIGGR